MFRKIILCLVFVFCLSGFGYAQKWEGTVNGNAAEITSNPKNYQRKGDNALSILSKPNPSYTVAARNNNVQGIVSLRVAFLKNGKIGDIKIVSGLPDGLTDKAIGAAKQIRFQPATIKGKAVTVTKTVAYTFTLY